MIVKHFFSVSAAMLVMRLEQTGIIELWQRDSIVRTFGQGWRTSEPEPLVYQALAYDFISLGKALRAPAASLKEVERRMNGGLCGSD